MPYREGEATAAPRRIVYGPFVPEPWVVVLVLALVIAAGVLRGTIKSSGQLTCVREHTGAAPTCTYTWRELGSAAVHSSPAALHRSGPSGNSPPAGAFVDAISYDGITLLLANNPPGPLSRFLDDPKQLRANAEASTSPGLVFGPMLFIAIAFFFPRLFYGVSTRRLFVDTAAGTLLVRTSTGVRPRTHLLIPIASIVAVGVEAPGGALHGRIVLRLASGIDLPLIPALRPWRALHLQRAAELASALGLPAPRVVLPRQAVRLPGRVLALQIGCALAALSLLILWLVHAG